MSTQGDMNPRADREQTDREIDDRTTITKGPPSYKRPYLMAIAAFVAGVIGTAAVTSRMRPGPPVPAAGGAEQHQEEAGHDKQGAIELSEAAAKTAGIRIEPARLTPIGEGLTVPGTVELGASRGAKVTPPAPGKVMRILVSLGDKVRMGQPLVVMDSYDVAQAHASARQAQSGVQQARSAIQTALAEVDQARATVNQAQAEIDQARTRQASAEIALQRQRDLAKAGAFAQAPLQAAQSEVAAAQSELLQAQTDLQAHMVVLQRAERLFKEELVSRAELEQVQVENRQDQARVAQAQTRVGSAKQTLEREQRVFSGDLLSKQAVQTAEAEVRAAQGDVQKARQGLIRAQQDVRRAQKGEQAARTMLQGAEDMLRSARANLYALEGAGHTEGGGGLVTVSAPIGGVVTERTATIGEVVERTTGLLVIENLSAVTVNANVPEQDVARIRVGQSVVVSVPAYPKLRFPGTVQSIAGRVDEKTRALTVRCLVENRSGLLRPEMFAKVTLGIGARANALTVPVSALEEEGDERFVYVEEQGKYERRKVEIGRTMDSLTEIKSGIKPGDRVVVEGLFVLKSETNKDKLKGDE